MITAHLPTIANDGVRTQGLSAERGHADAQKQMAPSPLANEITAGTKTKTTTMAPMIAGTAVIRCLGSFIVAA